MKTTQKLTAALLTSAAIFAAATPAISDNQVTSPTGTTAEWQAQGAAAVAKRAAEKLNTKRAKNVILFVGDGMSVSTLTAGRIMEGQLAGQPGEENYLSFERFPYTALVKTYNVDAQVPDSAGTASALNTGTKTYIGAINTAPTHPHGVCEGSSDDAPKPLAFMAEEVGMSTGVVSTARLTHATPAAVYARAAARGWEGDTTLPEEAVENGCADIASQIVGDMGGDGLEVALGGGARFMLPEGTGEGRRKDGRDLTKEWVSRSENASYVDTKTGLDAVDFAKTDKLMGLFGGSHMEFTPLRNEEIPSLPDLTEAAIKLLSKNDNGYYLMVEAGRIDHAHHGSAAGLALHETVELSAAVRKAVEMVDLEDTLIIVTADHGHTFTLAGYPKRGNPILGLVSGPKAAEGEYTLAKDGKPYTTAGYQNGPGAIEGERETLTQEQVQDLEFRQQSAIPLDGETHGGGDVAAHAAGPWSHLVRGTIEQNEIFHVMKHALGLSKRLKEK